MSLNRYARIAAFLGALSLLTIADVANTGELSPSRLAARTLVLAALVGGSWLVRQWRLAFASVAGLSVLLTAVYFLSRTTSAAWLALVAFWITLSGVESVLVSDQRWPLRWLVRAFLAGLGALAPLILDQVESHFADEEFFVAVTLLLLTGALFLLFTACDSSKTRLGESGQTKNSYKTDRVTRILVLSAAGGLFAVLAVVAVRGYRASFYPDSAPGFAGISAESPILCGEVPPASATADGQAVWERLVARLEARPRKTSPDLAFLALARHDEDWADAFRQELLAEAREGAYTGPANSVKSVQLDAAYRIYFAVQVHRVFPGLFSADEWAEVENWAAQVNQRALRPEWVDWLYAFAFGAPVQGPYFNQEIGAGLLSVLNESGLIPGELQDQNRAYLQEGDFGWDARFRYPDDSYYYQTVWLVSAYLQSLVDSGTNGDLDAVAHNGRLAFEWLLAQARPDGTAPPYNHPARPELASLGHLGAMVLQDPRYVWLADRALAALEAQDRSLPAIPGLEDPVQLAAEPPTIGSCLLYGGSGLPTSAGPLAPDKIVFRDGWTEDATWLALNLRFTGWHRYKASNHMIGLYQGGDVVIEQGRGRPYAWLPEGRSLPRDKRLAREDMNGLQVPRRGLGRVLWTLTGQGSPWAQDPPPYASVERFETLGGLDMSRTTLDDWRGWDHARTVYFFPGGPVFIVDEAQALSSDGQTAVTWHLAGEGQASADGLRLASPQGAVRLSWPEDAQSQLEMQPSVLPGGGPGWDVVYHAPDRDHLDLTTVYLGPSWEDAKVDHSQVSGESGTGWLLNVESSAGRQRALHNPTPERLEAGGLSTDGLAVTFRQTADSQSQVCYVGGTEVRVDMAQPPADVTGGRADWSYLDGVLVLRPNPAGAPGCVQVLE